MVGQTSSLHRGVGEEDRYGFSVFIRQGNGLIESWHREPAQPGDTEVLERERPQLPGI